MKPVRFEPMPCWPAGGAELGMEAEIDEGVGVGAGDDEDRSPVSAVATARTAARNELLAAKRQATVAAVAGDDVNVDFVDEHQGSLLVLTPSGLTPGAGC